MSKRQILLNPGPVNVTERVRKALLKPDICHREEEFSELLREIREKLLCLFGIESTHEAAFFTGSGTLALEAMLASFAEKEKKTLVLSNGVYGERIRRILELQETPVALLESGIGDFPAFEKIEDLLKKDSSIHAVAMVHHETSTGMLNPLAEVGALAKKYQKLFFVDAISSLGAEAIDFKKIGIDVCAGTSGKCLHGFPGVSFVLLSKKAAVVLENKKPRSLSMDLANALKFQRKNDTAFTPAVQLFYAFSEALSELEREGLERRIKNYSEKSRLLAEGMAKLGVPLVIPNERRSHVLTAFWLPTGISYSALHGGLKKSGFVIYAGQSSLAGKIFRIANLGDVRLSDIRRLLAETKRILN